MFEVNTCSVIAAHKIISETLRSIKGLLPGYEKYLVYYNDIIITPKEQSK